MTTIRIFLASSSELKEDREQFEIFINRKNKRLCAKGIFLYLDVWEDFLDAISQTRLQDEYNKAIGECDIFVMLFFTKVGKYTEEEFETAFGEFKDKNKPGVYTYFKNAPILSGDIRQEDQQTVWNFQKKLEQLGH